MIIYLRHILPNAHLKEKIERENLRRERNENFQFSASSEFNYESAKTKMEISKLDFFINIMNFESRYLTFM